MIRHTQRYVCISTAVDYWEKGPYLQLALQGDGTWIAALGSAVMAAPTTGAMQQKRIQRRHQARADRRRLKHETVAAVACNLAWISLLGQLGEGVLTSCSEVGGSSLGAWVRATASLVTIMTVMI